MKSYSVRDIAIPVCFFLCGALLVSSDANAFDYHAPPYEELTASISGDGVIGDTRNSIIYFSSTGELAFEKNEVASDDFIVLGSTSSQFSNEAGNYFVWDTHPVYYLQYYEIGEVLPPGLSKSFLLNDLKIHPQHTDYFDLIYVVPEPSTISLLAISLLPFIRVRSVR